MVLLMNPNQNLAAMFMSLLSMGAPTPIYMSEVSKMMRAIKFFVHQETKQQETPHKGVLSASICQVQ